MHLTITYSSSSSSNLNPLSILLPCCFSTYDNLGLGRKDKKNILKADRLKKTMDNHYVNEDCDFSFEYFKNLRMNDIESLDKLKELKKRDDNFKIVNNLAKYPKQIDFILDKNITARLDNVNFLEAKSINDFLWDLIEDKNFSKKLKESISRKSTSDGIERKVLFSKTLKCLLKIVEIVEFDLIFCQINKLSPRKSFKEEKFFDELKKMINGKIKQNRFLLVLPKLFDLASISELFDVLGFELYLNIFNVTMNVKTEHIFVMATLKKENKKEVSQYSFNPLQYENSVSCNYNDFSSAEFIAENEILSHFLN